jgi:superfamily II DNA or RNA helicase
MSAVELTEAFLAKIAGWEAMKRARALLESGKVLSSNWTPPILRGVVQEGTISYRAGLVIKDSIDLENMCGCRESRQWGTICAHSVAVGLHHLHRNDPVPEKGLATVVTPAIAKPASPAMSAPLRSTGRRLRCAKSGGEPLEISIILPPNLAQAMAKGVIMVCFEGSWRRGRGPLSALDRNTSFELDEKDEALLHYVEEVAGDVPGLMQLRGEAFGKLLKHLVGHPRITLGKARSLQVSDQPWFPSLQAQLQANGEIRLQWRNAAAGSAVVMAGERQAWVLEGDVMKPIGLPERYLGLLREPLTLSRAQAPYFLGQDWLLLTRNGKVEANFKLEDFSFVPEAPRFILALDGGLAQLNAVFKCAYGARIMTLGETNADESLWMPDPSSPTRYSTRDVAAEQAAQARLARAGFARPDAHGRWCMTGQDRVLNFFAREYPRLQKIWEVTLEERLGQSTARNIERIEPEMEIISSGENWFDLRVDYKTASGGSFSPADIQHLLLSGQSHRRLANGKFAVIDTGAVEELQEVLVDCAPEQHSGNFRFSSAHAGFLTATLREQTSWELKAPEEWKNRFQAGVGATAVCPALGELETTLRPYQKSGVAWLDFLRRNGFGGILADEMGLGKTVQMLAFLKSIAGQAHAPSIIVCPTSLVFNWVAEVKKFTPGLRVLAIEGPDRRRLFKEIPKNDLIVTSYALIRRDAEHYKGLEFEAAVLDEAQHIKNRKTQNAQAVKTICARRRFVLTGTPMENSVLDLWSIFDFLMPGYLGQARDFRERYEWPIARDKDTAAQARLARRIRPFILRRLKKDVLQDLPEKMEQISYCDLSAGQGQLYQQVLEAGRREITEAVGANGLAKSRMLVFTTLLRLRQICCDPRLLKLDGVDKKTTSGKTEMFGELLEEVLDGDHRVLVFSQFTTMLGLIREALTAEGIPYCYLDGETTNRAEVVSRFQNDATIPVFLLSLKAGGVGLNLTGADTVIHFDPWWNPAVEDQATDRAHRIGQTRMVTSYKLITRGTVEEKILHLQQRKRELIAGALGDEEALSQLLSFEEVLELMS